MFEQENGVDFSRLNEPERQVLRLLAEGHTAKSIANELGSTPAAVNERLREARRKTGVGSSRELARLLKSRENRHDEMGVAGTTSDAASQATEAASRRGVKGVLVMSESLIGVAAAFLLVTQTTAPSIITDSELGFEVDREGPAWLYPMIRKEIRDPKWAPETESILRERFSKVGLLKAPSSALRVVCSSTVCEIAASITVTEPEPEVFGQHSQLNRTTREFQDLYRSDEWAKAGLVQAGALFTSAKGKPDRAVILAYYLRAKG